MLAMLHYTHQSGIGCRRESVACALVAVRPLTGWDGRPVAAVATAARRSRLHSSHCYCTVTVTLYVLQYAMYTVNTSVQQLLPPHQE